MPAAPAEQVVRLLPGPAARAPRRRVAPVRFGLAAAVASIAVGGVAAAAGTGLLGRALHTNAGPAPSVSVSSTGTPDPTGRATSPVPAPSGPQRPLRESPEAGTTAGAHTPGGLGDEGTAGFTGGGGNEPSGDGTARERDPNRERENRTRALDLCKDYRSGRMDDDRRERLSKLARSTSGIARFCQTVMDGDDRTTGREGADGSSDGSGGGKKGTGSGILQVPTPSPSSVPLPRANGDLDALRTTR
ncbi:hypothetical protein EF918_01815 [Streptomyces sp. WAC06614]|nr:hypothetical protein EF918_01815 [Streptomyces sp. WAC06614]